MLAKIILFSLLAVAVTSFTPPKNQEPIEPEAEDDEYYLDDTLDDDLKEISDDLAKISLKIATMEHVPEYITDTFYHATSLHTLVGIQILNPEEDDSEEEENQYMDTVATLKEELIPQIKESIKRLQSGLQTRGALDVLTSVVSEQTKVLGAFLGNGLTKLKESGMPGVAGLVSPFVGMLAQSNSQFGNLLKFANEKFRNLEQGVHTLNEATGGMIKPLNELSTAIGGLDFAIEMIMDESVKSPRDIKDYLIKTFLTASQEIPRVQETLKGMCGTIKYVEAIPDEEEEEPTENEDEDLSGLDSF
ncbi:uncharacterized protein LOC141852568 isoform X2 [Brevipalpus obovatus]|uniref:uncharacterized protein LOC141852568 isoform X2 n=1 Tax=Brevipalpus obovatus TaxID=246614 RepID=UPI003D9EBAC0